MIGFVVTLCIEGLIGGVALRAILPGEQQWSIGQTFAFGLIAWLVVGFVFRAIFGVILGLILPIVVIGGLVLLVSRRRLTGGGGRRQLPR
ncbi:MAG: hypothetical protein QOD57_458 [Actinomycetota bacterium]|jgi:hypothetical protein|nr:hypothetical protein [Actinomycetota bacterium]MDQ1502731.1 hypothetical protein [Actinomycetota bacterium]